MTTSLSTELPAGRDCLWSTDKAAAVVVVVVMVVVCLGMVKDKGVDIFQL